jgi:hypothetical protein
MRIPLMRFSPPELDKRVTAAFYKSWVAGGASRMQMEITKRQGEAVADKLQILGMDDDAEGYREVLVYFKSEVVAAQIRADFAQARFIRAVWALAVAVGIIGVMWVTG